MYKLFLHRDISSFNETQTEELFHQLPLWRQEQAMKFKHLEGRRQCILSFLELKRGLSELYGMDEVPTFSHGAHGKPYFAEHPHIHFSISHCRTAVGCLIADRPCGFDVEASRTVREALIRHTMNADECSLILSSATPEKEFLGLWTQKEAVLKLIGTGIDDNLKEIRSRCTDMGIRLLTTDYGDCIGSIALQQ